MTSATCDHYTEETLAQRPELFREKQCLSGEAASSLPAFCPSHRKLARAQLRLNAVLAGTCHAVTGETVLPCRFAFIAREDFLKLFKEHKAVTGKPEVIPGEKSSGHHH